MVFKLYNQVDWWARRGSNPQSVRNTILSRARIPIPPLARKVVYRGVLYYTYSCYASINKYEQSIIH